MVPTISGDGTAKVIFRVISWITAAIMSVILEAAAEPFDRFMVGGISGEENFKPDVCKGP